MLLLIALNEQNQPSLVEIIVFVAAQYEAIRQAQVHAEGSPTERETRTFDVRTGRTVTIRSKEGAVDYRFMPEPDLPPIVLNNEVCMRNEVTEYTVIIA